MDKHDIDRLFDPTFNSCRDEAEFDLAWAVQSRLQDALQRGAKRPPPLRDKASIRRRQAAERGADERLQDQRERAHGADLFTFEEEDDPALAHVRAEVPADVRIDGWTAFRRILFLEMLEEHGSILAAARAVGMSRRAVYRLLPRAPAFAAAFEAAMSRVTATLADTLFDRALNGHEVPVMHQGDVVATRTVHHDMLGLYLLRVRDPLNYAPPDEGQRWLAGSGLKPIAHAEAPAALPSASGSDRVADDHKAATPATGDLCDLVQKSPPAASSRAKTRNPATSPPACAKSRTPDQLRGHGTGSRA